MKKFIYDLYCEDTEARIMGDTKLNLAEAVQKALTAMTNDQVLRPQEDWFELIVDLVCAQNNFMRDCPTISETIDVEDLYFDEVRRREDNPNE